MKGRSKKETFSYLHDIAWKKLNSWKEKTLSQVAKELLTKSVVQAIPTYAMSAFLLLSSITRSITERICNFWWKKMISTRRSAVKHRGIFASQRARGIGFKDLKFFNLALLCKQEQRIMKNPYSLLSRVIQQKYYLVGDFSSTPLGCRPSYAREVFLLLVHTFCKACDGGLEMDVQLESGRINDSLFPTVLSSHLRLT